jgi:hypothetical protein
MQPSTNGVNAAAVVQTAAAHRGGLQPAKIEEPEQAQSTPVSLYKKMLQVMGALDYIRKDGQNQHFNYSFVSESAVKARVQAELVRQGVLFKFEVIGYKEREVKSGWLTTIEAVYHFIDVDSGEEIAGSFFGQGADGQDKGIPKAIANSIKYILTSTFLIPTGDDPERDERRESEPEQPRPRRPTAIESKLKRDGVTVPPNSQAAADVVARQRIAELQQTAATSATRTTQDEMKRAFQTIRERLGETRYFAELDIEGIPDPCILAPAKARELYIRLGKLAKAEVQ